jgi:hypothetical protein
MADQKPLKQVGGRLKEFAAGDTISTTIAPGSGGGNLGEQIVAFGTPSPELTEVVQAVAAAWTSATSKIMLTIRRGDAEEDAAIQNLQCSVFNRVAGVGFDLHVSAPDGYSGDAVVMFSGV